MLLGGIFNSGMGSLRNSLWHGIASHRAHPLRPFRRALSVAIPVLAYICRYSLEMNTNASLAPRFGVHLDRFHTSDDAIEVDPTRCWVQARNLL